jgi:hypothetical protein
VIIFEKATERIWGYAFFVPEDDQISTCNIFERLEVWFSPASVVWGIRQRTVIEAVLASVPVGFFLLVPPPVGIESGIA